MRPRTKYIYDLPYCEREGLCRILELNSKWKTLGGLMGFSTLDIQCMEGLERRGKSPSDELLTQWSLKNHTVQELFVLLSRMHHFQAMSILKPFVDPEYHRLMFEGEESWTKLINDASKGACGPYQPPVNGISASSSNSSAAAVFDDKTCGGHNLNVMMPETQMLNKPGFADSKKIQNIGSPVSVEENNSPQPERGLQNTRAPGTPQSPLVPNVTGQVGAGLGPPLLSPAGVAALSSTHSPLSNIPMVHQRAVSSPQRKLSDVSLVTLPTECHNVLPMHDYKELEAATNGWSQSNVIGRGGFGTVFKGIWKNTVVAIKRIELPKGESQESQEVPYQQSHRELQVLQRIHHENILQLYSFSFNGNQPCLVYQFMEKGSLEDRLQCRHKTAPLTWQQRYSIAKGAARGLQYLHTVQDKPLIHGDIKSANILLDSNFEPRIGDFGLAREGPQSNYTSMKVSRVHGTKPYLPLEFLRSKKLSTKVDTYSFGVVLFEIATGLRAFDDKRVHKYLKDEVIIHADVQQLMDPKVVKAPMIFSHLIDLGKVCVSKLAKDRPEMKVVCQTLDQNTITTSQVTPRELQEYYDKMCELRRLSMVNTPHVSGQPGNSSSRLPVNLSGYPQYAIPLTGQPSLGLSGNAPAQLGSRGVGQIDLADAAQLSHAAVSSRPSVVNQPLYAQQTPFAENSVSPKAVPGCLSPTVGTSSLEPLLPAELPAVLNGILPSPTISIMPPTGSEFSANSSHSSLNESSDLTSQGSQLRSSEQPEEMDSSTEEQGPGNLPDLSILGVNKIHLDSSAEITDDTNSSKLNQDPGQPLSKSYPVFVNMPDSS